MNFELLRIAIALGGTAAAAYQDHKTSFIDDRITIGMIAAGFALNLLTFDYSFIAFSIGISLAILGVGFIAYKTGQLGGGDVLLFAGLHALLPVFPLVLFDAVKGFYPTATAQAVSFVAQTNAYPFFFSVFISASLFAMLGSAIQYALVLRGKKLKPDVLPAALVGGGALASIALINSFLGLSLAQAALFSAVFIPGLFLIAFKKQILSQAIIKRIALAEIEDEDVLATEEMPDSLMEKYGLSKVITKRELEKLKKIKANKEMELFPVYKNLPRFGPYILAGLMVSLLTADLFVLLLLF